MLYKLSDMQVVARENRFAIPHFLGSTIEMVMGAIKAGEEMNSPVAFGFAPEVFAAIPMEVAFPMILNAAEGAKIPVAVQLEHGSSYEQAEKAINLGVNSVMYDGSSLDYEMNIKNTKEIVQMAHSVNVCVEAELGHVGGSAIRSDRTNTGYTTEPEKVIDFISRTNVDTLAISFGNVHGQYRGKPNIDLDLVREIDALAKIPLVMHGGSGLTDDIYPRIVAAGISNIHFYTGIAMYAWGYVKSVLPPDEENPPYHEVVAHMIDYFYMKSKHVIEMLKAKEKAILFNHLRIAKKI